MNKSAWFAILLLFGLSLILSASLSAQTVVEPPRASAPNSPMTDIAALDLMGHLGGNAQAVSVVGSRAYVGIGAKLVGLDVSIPANPVLLGRAFLPSAVTAVSAVGGYVYAAAGANGLRVVSFANPNAPVEVAALNVPGGAQDMVETGNYLYVAAGNQGLRLISIANPLVPTEIGSYTPLSFTATSLTIASHYIYLVGQDQVSPYNNLRIIDISNPVAPAQVGAYHPTWNTTDVVVSGNHAYLAFYGYPPYPSTPFGGLEIVDISNPAAPAQAGTYDAYGAAWSVAVTGSWAYLGIGTANTIGLEVVNVWDPAHPLRAGFQNMAGYVLQLQPAGHTLYAATGSGGLRLLDISSPATPSQVGSFTRETAFADFEDVGVTGNYAYGISRPDFSLQIADVLTPSAPVQTGFFDLNIGNTVYFRDLTVAVSGTRAYVGWYSSGKFDNQTGLSILDVSTPATVTAVSAKTLFFAWMGTPQSNCTIALASDLSGSANPEAVASSWKSVVVAAADHYAYVAYGSTLCVVDVGNPISPTAVGMYTATGAIQAMTTAGRYAYLAAGSGGLRVVDVYSPSHPVEVGSYAVPGAANGVTVAGNYAYITAGDGRLRIVNVLTPSLPTEVGSLVAGQAANAVVVTDSVAFVAVGEQGVRAANVANPAAPYWMASYQRLGTVEAMAAQGPYLYVASGSEGLYVLKLTIWQGMDHQVFLPIALRSYTPPPQYFRFVAQHSGKCLNVAGASLDNGAQIIQWDCTGAANEQWQLAPVGDDFQVIARHSAKCLNIAGASQNNGAPAIQWECVGGDNELWRLQPVGNAYELIARHSNKCLTVANASLDNWAQVVQSDCKTEVNQLWQMQSLP